MRCVKPLVGSYSPWEFPLLASLLTGFILVGIDTYPKQLVSIKLALSIYVGAVVGSFLLTLLLGIIYRPIIRWLSGSLSNDAIFNLSMMNASIFTIGSIISLIFYSYSYSHYLLFPPNIMAMILSFFFSLLIAWLVLRNIERALLIAVVLTLIFVALNYLYYVAM